MRTLSRHKSRNKRVWQIALVSLCVVGLGLLLPKAVSVVSTIVMYPIHGVHVWLQESESLIPALLRDKKQLHEQIAELENELIVVNNSDLSQQRLSEENVRLRELLGIGNENRIAATVIARPNELPYDLLQIDRGENHGVEVGAPVFVGQDVVIGLVVHTGQNFSFVQLITSPNFEATAFIAGPDITTVVEGLGGGQSRVRVPQGISITVGNLVHLPSVEPGVFGRISYIESRPTQPEQYGYISPDVSISSLHYVSVGSLSQITKSITEINDRISEQINIELLVKEIGIGQQATSSVTSTPTIDSVREN